MTIKVLDSKKELMSIPGIGTSLAEDLLKLGYSSIASLRDANPEEMYVRMEIIAGEHVDRCVLYVFRCAVYFAHTKTHNPELLKWWNWKDTLMSDEKRSMLCD